MTDLNEPAGGFGQVLIDGVEGRLPPGVEEDLDVLNQRRCVGYAIGIIGILGVSGILVFSVWSIHSMPEPSPGMVWFEYGRLGAHAVLMVAAVWFCYQLLRAAERMLLPYWWVRYNTDVVRMMLGIADPWRSAMKAGEQLVELSSKATEQAVGIVGAVTGSAPPVKRP
jgi:hypothetical protein